MVTAQETTPTESKPAVPSCLVYEVLNGRPLYYRGYREVMEKKLNPESVVGSSSLQSILISLIYGYILSNRDKKKYLPVTNEAGGQLDLNNKLSCDVAIFEKGTVDVTTKQFDTAPRIVIEVDVKIDLVDFRGEEFNYVATQTQRLFDSGVERIFWVFSQSRRIFVCVPGQDWTFTDWHNDILVMDNCVLNVGKLLDEEGISY